MKAREAASRANWTELSRWIDCWPRMSTKAHWVANKTDDLVATNCKRSAKFRLTRLGLIRLTRLFGTHVTLDHRCLQDSLSRKFMFYSWTRDHNVQFVRSREVGNQVSSCHFYSFVGACPCLCLCEENEENTYFVCEDSGRSRLISRSTDLFVIKANSHRSSEQIVRRQIFVPLQYKQPR